MIFIIFFDNNRYLITFLIYRRKDRIFDYHNIDKMYIHKKNIVKKSKRENIPTKMHANYDEYRETK